ncbi:hypothetical protein RKD54_003755 [Pseudarthrobacter sp. SLBN-100]
MPADQPAIVASGAPRESVEPGGEWLEPLHLG